MGNEYYDKVYIQHLIREHVVNREVSVLGGNNANVRALKIKCLYDFERILKLINWKKHKQNFYCSVSTLKDYPPDFTFSMKERKNETQPWYRNEYHKLIKHHDIFFDFDDSYSVLDKNGKPKREDGEIVTVKGTWEEIVDNVKILKDYLDEYRVSYYILFSGKKGFQLIIPGEYLEIEKIERGNVFPQKTIAENVREALDLKFMDTSNNGIGNRLRKIPYSLVGDNIALPLSDEQFNNFDINDMKVDNVLSKVSLMRRGNLERFNDRTLEQKKEAVKTFIKMFEL